MVPIPANGCIETRGELYLAHKFLGVEVDIKYASECLKNLRKLWGRGVHLQARIDDDMVLFSHDGESLRQQKIKDDLPRPAHVTIQ